MAVPGSPFSSRYAVFRERPARSATWSCFMPRAMRKRARAAPSLFASAARVELRTADWVTFMLV